MPGLTLDADDLLPEPRLAAVAAATGRGGGLVQDVADALPHPSVSTARAGAGANVSVPVQINRKRSRADSVGASCDFSEPEPSTQAEPAPVPVPIARGRTAGAKPKPTAKTRVAAGTTAGAKPKPAAKTRVAAAAKRKAKAKPAKLANPKAKAKRRPNQKQPWPRPKSKTKKSKAKQARSQQVKKARLSAKTNTRGPKPRKQQKPKPQHNAVFFAEDTRLAKAFEWPQHMMKKILENHPPTKPLHVQMYSEFSGAGTAEFAMQGLAAATSRDRLCVDVVSVADWDSNAASSLVANTDAETHVFGDIAEICSERMRRLCDRPMCVKAGWVAKRTT